MAPRDWPAVMSRLLLVCMMSTALAAGCIGPPQGCSHDCPEDLALREWVPRSCDAAAIALRGPNLMMAGGFQAQGSVVAGRIAQAIGDPLASTVPDRQAGTQMSWSLASGQSIWIEAFGEGPAQFGMTHTGPWPGHDGDASAAFLVTWLTNITSLPASDFKTEVTPLSGTTNGSVIRLERIVGASSLGPAAYLEQRFDDAPIFHLRIWSQFDIPAAPRLDARQALQAASDFAACDGKTGHVPVANTSASLQPSYAGLHYVVTAPSDGDADCPIWRAQVDAYTGAVWEFERGSCTAPTLVNG